MARIFRFAGNLWFCQGSQTACFGVSFRNGGCPSKYSFRLIRNQITHSRHELLDRGIFILIKRLLIYLNISKRTFDINHVNGSNTNRQCGHRNVWCLVASIRAIIVCDYLSLICNLTSKIQICKL